jgi:hypothetical protein
MKRRTVLIACVCMSLFPLHYSYALPETVTRVIELDGPSWNYAGPIPETYYTPWLPLPSIFVRTRIGARFSSSTINLKCPMKVSISYDPAKAMPGSSVPIEVNIEPTTPQSGYVFESAFEVYLPSDVQVGFVGEQGIPDSILPWRAIDCNLWDLLGFIPNVDADIAVARNVIGVNMRSGKDSDNNQLPLNKSKEYHDTRVLIDLTDTVLSNDVIKEALTNKLYGKIPDPALTSLKLLLTENEIKVKIGAGIEKFAKLASLKIKGDLSYKVKGQKFELRLHYQVPGKAMGEIPFSQMSPTAKVQNNIHIPYSAKPTDDLQMKVVNVGYYFTLFQTLKIQVSIPIIGDVDIVNCTNTITQKAITVDVPADKGNFTIPLDKYRADTQLPRNPSGTNGEDLLQEEDDLPVMKTGWTTPRFTGNKLSVGSAAPNSLKHADAEVGEGKKNDEEDNNDEDDEHGEKDNEKGTVSTDQYIKKIFSSSGSVSQTTKAGSSLSQLNITRKTSTASPGGYVYDSKGAPIQGASVTMKTPTSKSVTVKTNENGHFTTDVLTGGPAVTVEIDKTGYIKASAVGYIDAYYHKFRCSNITLNSSIGTANITVKKNTIAYANARLEICSAPGVLPAIATNTLTATSSGKATYNQTFQEENQSMVLIAKVVPPEDSKVFPQSVPFTLGPGMSTDVLIVCETDEVVPVISEIVINKDAKGFVLGFKSNEKALYTVEAKNPQGLLVQPDPAASQWAYMAGTDFNVITSYKIPASSNGTYKIKIKVKDMKGNMAETPYRDVVWKGP